MNIIKPTYEILTPISDGGIKELQFIEKAARICYKSEDRITEDGESAKKMVKMLVDKHHEAMIEHSQLSVLFTVDRGIANELVRHRIASFAQESTRYVSYTERNKEIVTEEDVLYAYCEIGLSMKKISERSNGKYTEWDVYKLLDTHDIERRSLGSRGLINETYFDVIDTPEKAYLIGFIMADGSIRRDSSQLTIAQKKDEQWWILNMIRTFIQPEAKSLTIHNKHLCNSLIDKGIIPNKTYESTSATMQTLWSSIHDDYKYDFIRGLLDGDGCIRWFYQTDTSKKQSCNICFTGNKYLLNIISDFIKEEFGYSSTTIQEFKNYAKYYITDSEIGKNFCKKLYANFIFPYGHSKTTRYYEAFNLTIPCLKANDYRSKDFKAIIPEYEVDGGKNGLCGKQLWVWGNAIFDAEMHYKNMIELGATPQIARSVLPSSTKTEIVVTANYREWRNIFNLRTPISAHPQMREIMIPLLKDVQNRIPIIFDDIIIEE